MMHTILRQELLAVLSSHPELELVGSGSHANSLREWFVIRHAPSGKWFSIDAATITDLRSRYFLGLLEGFLQSVSR
jgi:hypothetical protein